MSTINGLRISLDGTLEDLQLERESGTLVGPLSKAIGCDWFDLVRLEDGIDLFVDDEGMYRSSPNPVMSMIARRLGNTQPILFGAGIFLNNNPDTGDTLSLTTDQHARITNAFGIVTPLVPIFGIVIQRSE